jgi:DNA-binding GntR family transcriptional regulator
VHAQLREDVLRGVLPPGSRLRFVELAARFSVSQSVVREALTRLAEQGLAVAQPQQGFRVRPLTLTDLDELTDARVEIETMVLRRSIERGDIAWASSVVAAHHQLANTPITRPSGDLAGAWFTAHEEFHRAALRGCANERLYGVAVALRDAASLYRWWSRPVGHDYDREVELEHRQILDAIVANDSDAAADLLTRHIQRTSDALRSAAMSDTALAADGTSPM